MRSIGFKGFVGLIGFRDMGFGLRGYLRLQNSAAGSTLWSVFL